MTDELNAQLSISGSISGSIDPLIPGIPPVPSLAIGRSLATNDGGYGAGVDEVGRGALFGPVVAAAVILDPAGEAALRAAGVRDSKKLSAKRRQALVPVIQGLAVAWSIAAATVEEIDRLNILEATFLAMGRAIGQLEPAADRLFVDGNRPIPAAVLPAHLAHRAETCQTLVIGGDNLVVAIAAASILAKVDRDRQMAEADRAYPGYGLAAHKGYGTAAHRAAITRLGPTDQHRRSFAPCR